MCEENRAPDKKSLNIDTLLDNVFNMMGWPLYTINVSVSSYQYTIETFMPILNHYRNSSISYI